MHSSLSGYRVFAGRLLGTHADPMATVFEVEGDSITRIRAPAPGEEPAEGDLDAREFLVVPGFVDTHLHGGFGLDPMDGQQSTVRRLASRLPERGVTAFLVTPLTAPWERIREVVAAAAQVRKAPEGGARVLGCHLEGPFLSPEYRGAQNPDHLRAPDFPEMEAALGDLLEEVRIVTLAPEMPRALDAIRHLTASGIRVSIGHTGATFDQVSAAIDCGASRVTHCYNAMRGLHHREPGVVGAAFLRPELDVELIWDNVHVHPSACRLLVEVRGSRGVIAISDGTTGVGMPEGFAFELCGLPTTVSQGAARLAEGTLAGSTIALDDAFRNATREIGLERAVDLCSTAPAASLGLLHEIGFLAPGCKADFLLIDEKLNLVATFVGGREMYHSDRGHRN